MNGSSNPVNPEITAEMSENMLEVRILVRVHADKLEVKCSAFIIIIITIRIEFYFFFIVFTPIKNEIQFYLKSLLLTEFDVNKLFCSGREKRRKPHYFTPPAVVIVINKCDSALRLMAIYIYFFRLLLLQHEKHQNEKSQKTNITHLPIKRIFFLKNEKNVDNHKWDCYSNHTSRAVDHNTF